MISYKNIFLKKYNFLISVWRLPGGVPGGRAVTGDLDLRLHVEHHRNRIGQETGRSQVLDLGIVQ